MAKQISFDNTNYNIDEASLSKATAALKSHLSTVMNGSGATINLGGTSYNVDSTKLQTAMSNFIAHLGKISGTGSNIVVNDVSYSIDSSKLSDAIAELHTVLGGLNSGDGNSDNDSDGGLNEYGFYFERFYLQEGTDTGMVLHSDGSASFYYQGELEDGIYIESGVLIYSYKCITNDKADSGSEYWDVSEDGLTITIRHSGIKYIYPKPSKDEDDSTVLATVLELNQYGFYFGIPYAIDMENGFYNALIFNEDNTSTFCLYPTEDFYNANKDVFKLYGYGSDYQSVRKCFIETESSRSSANLTYSELTVIENAGLETEEVYIFSEDGKSCEFEDTGFIFILDESLL